MATLLANPGCKKNPAPAPKVDGGSLDGNRDAIAADALRADATPACSPGAGDHRKGKAEACTCNGECQSGFCADGVCCTSACTDACKSCGLLSALGDCGFIPAGVKATHAPLCALSTPGTCGFDGKCDGQGGCRKYVGGTECVAGKCDGDTVGGRSECDGKGNCAAVSATNCYPFSCDPSNNQCATQCTSDSLCAAGQKCQSQSCGKKLNGYACPTGDGECASGHCADGVCCNVSCTGACVSCNQTGSLGRCQFIPAGIPDLACTASDRSTCGETGLCDGYGACLLFPQNTPCGSASCTDVYLNTTPTCDGLGTCRPPQLVDCFPFLCTSGICNSTCSKDTECSAGHACVASSSGATSVGLCGKKRNGQTCANAGECESNQCVDGVCCESSCDGACRNCALPNSLGQCIEVGVNAPDPRQTCLDTGAPSCGTTGLCDGSGACQKYAVGTECGPESCAAGVHTPPSTCNSSGQCVEPQSKACNPFVCNGKVCFAACNNDNQCVAGSFCSAASCGPKPPGAECSAATECASGFCAQGVCCNSACSGACKACNLSGSLGLCNSVSDGSPDPQGLCPVTLQSTCGTTGSCKGGACAYFGKGLNCKAAQCASISAQTPVSTCDGVGACATPGNVPCGTFICSAAACKSTCLADSDCVPPNTCAGNSCGLKPVGTACTAGTQCVSGFCTEGVCCDSACSDDATTGLCKSCKLSGKVGTCLPVAALGLDPKGRCVASSTGTDYCKYDGTCNGSGACSPRSNSTGCRPESCTGSVHTIAATCDGAGACPAANTSSCGSYVCNSPSPTCLSTCQKNADCTGTITCNTITKKCGDKSSAGDQCSVGTDCTSGFCVDGYCCDKACTDSCQSCTLTNKVGTCSNIGSGQPPRDSTACAPASSGSCGNTGNCDGSDKCEVRATCNDNNKCTQTDSCTQPNQLNQCVGISPVTCSPSDSCHAVGTCDPATGVCSNPPITDGTSCSDGNACTLADTCQAGVCHPGTQVTCTALDQCHAVGTCNTTSGICTNPAKANGTACNDGNANTVGDVCTNGSCAGIDHCIGVTCPLPDQCHVAGACVDHATGACSNPNKADGTACNDANANTVGDVCTGGVCVGVDHCIGVTCPLPDQCHVPGTCVNHTTGACSNPNKLDGSTCVDGNPNTTGDICTNGNCAGVDHCSGVTCTALDQCHLAGTCIDHATGACSNPAKANTATCTIPPSCTNGTNGTNGVASGGDSTCDGAGNCTVPTIQDCGLYRCDSAAQYCLTVCSTNGDCVSNVCDTTSGVGVCQP